MAAVAAQRVAVGQRAGAAAPAGCSVLSHASGRKSFPGVHCSGVPVIRLLLIVQFFTSNNVTCLALIEILRF